MEEKHNYGKRAAREVYQVDCRSAGDRAKSSILKDLILKELRTK